MVSAAAPQRLCSADQSDESFECQVSKLPANVRHICARIITRRNAQNSAYLVSASFALALAFFMMNDAPCVTPSIKETSSWSRQETSSWSKQAQLHGMLTLYLVGMAAMFPGDIYPTSVPLWVPLFSISLLFVSNARQLFNCASLHQEEDQEAHALFSFMGQVRALYIFRYLWSLSVQFILVAYYGKQIRPWTTMRRVNILLILFRLSLLVILNAYALSLESMLSVPGQLSFSSVAATDVYVLLLLATFTTDVRHRISTVSMQFVPNCAPSMQADLASLSQAAAVHKDDTTSRAGYHYAEMAPSPSETDAGAEVDTDTIVASSYFHVGNLMDYHYAMPTAVAEYPVDEYDSDTSYTGSSIRIDD